MPLQPAADFVPVYADADVLLLNQKAAVKDAVIPSKLLTYMAAGKAVLCAANSDSEASRLVQQAHCGAGCRTRNPAGSGRRSAGLARESALRRTMGSNGRAYAEGNYSKAHVLHLYDHFFASFSKTRQPAAVTVAAD